MPTVTQDKGDVNFEDGDEYVLFQSNEEYDGFIYENEDHMF